MGIIRVIQIAPAPGSIEAASREIDFWTNFTANLGFTGP